MRNFRILLDFWLKTGMKLHRGGYGGHQIDDKGLSVEAKRSERERFAREDFEDIMNADAVISFTEVPRTTKSRGGRHVEFGIALAAGKKCIIVGPRENVFHCLPWVDVVDTIVEANRLLSQ